MLRALELPPVLASALGDWVDADSDTSPDGAEDAYYLALSPPYRAANRALTDVDGLLRVRGFDASVVERLRPHVTALPGYHRVNVNSASAIMLAVLIPDMPPSEIQQLLAQRNKIPFKDFGEFRSRLPRPEITPNPEQLDTRSRYFRVLIRARYGLAGVTTEALLDRSGIDWPAIVWHKYQ